MAMAMAKNSGLCALSEGLARQTTKLALAYPPSLDLWYAKSFPSMALIQPKILAKE